MRISDRPIIIIIILVVVVVIAFLLLLLLLILYYAKTATQPYTIGYTGRIQCRLFPLAAVAQIPIAIPHSFLPFLPSSLLLFPFPLLSFPLSLPFPLSRSLSCLMGPEGTTPGK